MLPSIERTIDRSQSPLSCTESKYPRSTREKGIQKSKSPHFPHHKGRNFVAKSPLSSRIPPYQPGVSPHRGSRWQVQTVARQEIFSDSDVEPEHSSYPRGNAISPKYEFRLAWQKHDVWIAVVTESCGKAELIELDCLPNLKLDRGMHSVDQGLNKKVVPFKRREDYPLPNPYEE